MGVKRANPFLTPTNKDWERSLKREFKERAGFYKRLTILIILIPIPYLVFTWVTSADDLEKLKPEEFFMVSYADIYQAVEGMAKERDPRIALAEARFFVSPYIDNQTGLSANFLYKLEGKDTILISVRYQNGIYEIRPYPVFSGNSGFRQVEAGAATPLPEEFIFEDSLLAFDRLLVELKPMLTEDYLHIEWPAVLVFYADSNHPVWELCYHLRNSAAEPTCADTSDLDASSE